MMATPRIATPHNPSCDDTNQSTKPFNNQADEQQACYKVRHRYIW